MLVVLISNQLLVLLRRNKVSILLQHPAFRRDLVISQSNDLKFFLHSQDCIEVHREREGALGEVLQDLRTVYMYMTLCELHVCHVIFATILILFLGDCFSRSGFNLCVLCSSINA